MAIGKLVDVVQQGHGSSTLALTFQAANDDFREVTDYRQIKGEDMGCSLVSLMGNDTQDDYNANYVFQYLVLEHATANTKDMCSEPFKVYGHGSGPNLMWVPTKDGGHGLITAHVLAQYILHETSWKPNRTILLAACESGWENPFVRFSFAHQLALELHTTVIAPDHIATWNDFEQHAGDRSRGWITYHPDGTHN
jgi:hypothetical protein